MSETAFKRMEKSEVAGAKTFHSAPEYGEASTFRGLSTPDWRQGAEQPQDFSQSMQGPELATALKLSRDPAQTVDRWRLQSLLADEMKLPPSVMNGPIFDQMKSARATRYSDLVPGAAISDGELARKIEFDRQAQASMETKDPRFKTKLEAFQQVFLMAPSGWENFFLVSAAAQFASIPTLDDPIVILRSDPSSGQNRELYRVWNPDSPIGWDLHDSYELALKRSGEVFDRLNGVKPKERHPAIYYNEPERPEPKGELMGADEMKGRPQNPPPGPDMWSSMNESLNTAGKVGVDGALRLSRGLVNWGFDVKTGINLWMREWAKQFSNPYVFKTVEEAKADLKRIDARMEALTAENERSPRQRVSEYTAEDLARLKELDELRKQRPLAEMASRGIAVDSTVGAFYSVAKQELEWNREARRKVNEAYAGVINPEYDKSVAMQAVEGLGGSAVDLIGTVVLLPLGTTTTFLRNQGAAYEEYVGSAAERGLDTSEEAEMAYSLNQAGTATAIDMVGNLAQVGMVGRLATRGGLLRKGLAVGVGTGVDLAAGAGQTVAEQKIAEEHGVRDRMSMDELNARLRGEAEVGMATNALLTAVGLGAGKARSMLGREESQGRTHYSKAEGEGEGLKSGPESGKNTSPHEGIAATEEARRAVEIFNRVQAASGEQWRARVVEGTHPGRDGGEIEGVRDTGLLADGERLAGHVAGLFGRRIVIVETEGTGAPEFNGFVNSSPELSGYIFIHKGSVRPHLLTVGHELWHHISLSAPNLARTVREALDEEVRNWDAVRKGKDGYSSKEIPDELIGDFLGDSLIESSFWERLENRNPVAFSRLAAVVKPVLDRLLERLRASNFKSNSHIKDIERARDILADALVKFQEKPFGDSKIGPYEPNDPSANLYSLGEPSKAHQEVLGELRAEPNGKNAQALKRWFEKDFREIQEGVRPEDEQRINQMLDRLPVYKSRGLIFRGLSFLNENDRQAYLKKFAGRVWINDRPFMSASKEGGVVMGHVKNSGYPVIMAIQDNQTGKDVEPFARQLSQYGRQKEILYSKGAKFEVIKVAARDMSGKTLYAIEIREIQ